MIVTFTDEDMALAERACRLRTRGKSGRGWGSKGVLERGVEGMMGEIAFGKAYGLPADEQYYADGDGGVDFRVGDVTIGVRYTTVRTGRFMQDERGMRSDVGVLAVGIEERMVDLVAWIWREMFDVYKREEKYFGHVAWTVERNVMRPMKELGVILNNQRGHVESR